MTTVSLEQEGLTLHEVAELLRSGPVLVTAQGQPVMAVVALDEAEAEAWLMGQSEELMSIVERSRRELREAGGLSPEELRRELGLTSKS